MTEQEDSGIDPEMQRYENAKKRAREIRRFYLKVRSVFFANLFVFAIDLVSGPDDWWFYWFTLVSVATLIKQGFDLYDPFQNRFGDEWEERKIQELMGEKPKRKNKEDNTYFYEEA